MINILSVAGVVIKQDKWLTYDPLLLEGSEAAEEQCQSVIQRDTEAELDQLKERV